jgi:hypothetical protein
MSDEQAIYETDQNEILTDAAGETVRQIFANVKPVDPELQVALDKLNKPSPELAHIRCEMKSAAPQQCHLNNANNHEPRPEAGPDREVWVRDQIMTAMRMALSLKSEVRVRAEAGAFEHGMRGIAEGATIEILGQLGFDLHKLVNLRRIHGTDLC